MWLVTAVAVLSLGWVPRAAAAKAWAGFGYCAVVALFADSFDMPQWLQRGSPFAHTPQAPLDTLTAAPLLTLGALAIALAAGGYGGLRRRDLGY